jgi:glycine/D-amino acid oxidase-like deaminating enzyme
MHQRRQALIIGGGFFGLYLAEHVSTRYDHVIICERQRNVMQRASYGNQARVHNGYHYPRSLLTAFRSRINYPRFCDEFAACLDDSIESTYAIARNFTKVNARQFRLFMQRIGAPIEPAGYETRQLFDLQHIEDVFVTEECVFDSCKLKETMLQRIWARGIELRVNTEVTSLKPSNGQIEVRVSHSGDDSCICADGVFNCTYAATNAPLRASGIPAIALKHELAEMCLVDVPEPIRRRAVTVMCGPFFSCMPFPPRRMHTLSHVRYTPHCSWRDGDQNGRPHAACRATSFPHMIRDVRRYMPIMADCRYRDSIWETKAILPLSEVDDSRPILFKPHYGIANHHVVLGGKIDNVYDVVDEVDRLLGL